MKILLDNCVPRDFARQLPGHEVIHCSRLGWERLSNGSLLSAAQEAGFEAMVTVDQSIQFQQRMTGRGIALIYLRASKNTVETLAPMGELVLEALQKLMPGTVVVIPHPEGP